MVSRITSVAFAGIETTPVDVQVSISPGLPAFAIVGMADKPVAESRERVRAALSALGLPLPAKKIVVNLAPADLIKEGSHFDVPIALAVLLAMGILPASELKDFWAMGELSLDGRLAPVSGVLPAAIAAKAEGCGLICPAACGAEAAWASDQPILAASSLLALLNHFKGSQVLSPPRIQPPQTQSSGPDLREVKGQAIAKRALEIAAAGGHNLLMLGPPGAGKSMLAACLPSILPPMSAQEILEVSMIQSIAGQIQDGQLSAQRPFRDPHHSSSLAAMVGGGRRAQPGEISLAHRGVLFLDELPEFPRGVLESLRQPLETGEITVARAQAHVTYPANVQLIAAMNPCRCGYVADAARACNKAPRCAMDYQAKLSGPLLDRIDMQIEMQPVESWSMMENTPAESSAQVATRVAAARALQEQRYAGTQARTNADASGDVLQQACPLGAQASRLLEQGVAHFQLSMRGLTRVLRVARSIADLAGAAEVQAAHIAESLSYRGTMHSAACIGNAQAVASALAANG
jgi:magnesium chelatase family protein